MKTNLEAYNRLKLKRKLEEEEAELDRKIAEYDEVEEEEEDDYFLDEGIMNDIDRYMDDLEKSENFEVGDYPIPASRLPRRPNGRLQMIVGVPVVDDSSHSCPPQGLVTDRLLCFSRLAMAVYNIRMGTYFHVVKVLMATADALLTQTHYVTFEAFSLKREGNTEDAVTFQTKLLVFHPNNPCPKFQILFVRIKLDQNKLKNSQPSEFDPKAQVGEDRLSRFIKTYTIDSRLDSQYSLALYLSQYALVSHNFHVLSLFVAKHDFESLKVLKLVKPVAEDPTYIITFEAPLCAETEKNSVETFETKICMPTLFPATTIELRSEARAITSNCLLQST